MGGHLRFPGHHLDTFYQALEALAGAIEGLLHLLARRDVRRQQRVATNLALLISNGLGVHQQPELRLLTGDAGQLDLEGSSLVEALLDIGLLLTPNGTGH